MLAFFIIEIEIIQLDVEAHFAFNLRLFRHEHPRFIIISFEIRPFLHYNNFCRLIFSTLRRTYSQYWSGVPQDRFRLCSRIIAE